LIICFDPWNGLPQPAPALYPEYGDSFLHIAGMAYNTQEKWRNISSAVHSCPDTECWLLIPREHEKDAQHAAETIANNIRKINGEIPVCHLLWYDDDKLSNQRVESHSTGEQSHIEIKLKISEQASDQHKALLLSLSLRFLMERESLVSESDWRQGFSCLSMVTDIDTLNKEIRRWQLRLKHMERDLRNKRNQARTRVYDGKWYAEDNAVISASVKNTVDDVSLPEISSFFSSGQVKDIQEWLQTTCRKIVRDRGLRIDEIMSSFNDQQKAISRQNPVDYYGQKTPEALQRELRQAMKKHTAVQPTVPIDAEKEASEIRRIQLPLLTDVLRCLPDSSMAMAAFFLCLLMLTFSVGLGDSIATPVEPLHRWAWLPGMAGVMGIIALILISWLQANAKKSIFHACKLLTRLCKKLREDEHEHRLYLVACLEQCIHGRNLELVNKEIRNEDHIFSLLNYHIKQMGAHQRMLSVSDRESQPGENPERSSHTLEKEKPEFQNSIYFWQSTTDSTILKQGNTEVELRSDRFGGVKCIQIEKGHA